MIDDLQLLREYGPRSPALTQAASDAALGKLLDQMHRASPASPRRRPRIWRGVLLAVAVVTAVVSAVTTLQVAPSVPATAAPLVKAEPPMFPLTIEALPSDLTSPVYTDPTNPANKIQNPMFLGDKSGKQSVYYRSGSRDLVVIVDATPVAITGTRPVTVGGREFTVGLWSAGPGTGGAGGAPAVQWQISAGEVATMIGQRGFAADELLPIAASTSQTPIPISPALGILPAGWRPVVWKGSNVTTYAAGSGEELSLMTRTSAYDVAAPGFTDIRDAVVQGNPARLGRSAMGSGAWTITGSTANGRPFVISADPGFTPDRLIEIAQGVQIA